MAAEHSDNLDQNGRVEQFTDEEAHDFFDRAAWRYLHMSGDDFIRRYDAGEYDDDPDRHPIMMIISLLPLVDHPVRSL